MNVSNILNGILSNLFNLLNGYMEIDLKFLPSQGLFYKKDFSIKIRKASVEDIFDYKKNYDKKNIYKVINNIRNIIRKNVILSPQYTFEDIKSVDVIFLFLEIVKFTINKKVFIPYTNTKTGLDEDIEFDKKNFNYFDFSEYDFKESEILINGYKYTLPSIGVEFCLTYFLANKLVENREWENYSYDFLHFIGNRSKITDDEIENFVTIFNFDIDLDEKKRIKKIVDKFSTLSSYTLSKNNVELKIKPGLDFEKIWD